MLNDYIEFLHEVFADFGEIQAKPMFGGYGLFHSGLMFALVADEQLYLKVDNQSETAFDELGLPAFSFNKAGKHVKMSYRLAPEAIFDDPEEAKQWALLAYDAAFRSKKR